MPAERSDLKQDARKRIGTTSRTIVRYLWLAALAGMGASRVVFSAEPTPADEMAVQAARLVALLGDESFAARERATSQLIEIGWPARTALLAGKQHLDREIRYRCRRILALIDEIDFDRRLAAFAAGRDDPQAPLPAWGAFRTRFGDSTALRSVFIRLQQAEPEVLEAIESGEGVAAVLADRSAHLQRVQRVTRRGVALPNVLALLLAASDSGVTLDTATGTALAGFCYQPEVQNAAQDPVQRKVLRELLGCWVRQARGPIAHQALTLAMRFDLPEGLEVATRVLEQPDEPAAIRQSGILAILRLGDQQHQELLETLLDDRTRCASQRVNNVLYETQIRDVALAALLLMQEQDPRRFGFERMIENDATGFIPSTVGFEDDQQRASAFDQWKAHATTRSGDR